MLKSYHINSQVLLSIYICILLLFFLIERQSSCFFVQKRVFWYWQEEITEALNHIFVFVDPDGALFPWYSFSNDGWALWSYWIRDKNFQAKRIHVQFTQPTNEVEGSITTLSPFSNLNMLNIASYPSHFLFQHFKFRYLRMNHCKLTSGHLCCGLKKKFLKSIMNLLSLDT